MSPIRIANTFALVDADSEEARAFTTYLGYWDSLARVITTLYGEDYERGLVAELRSRKAFRGLNSSQFRGDREQLRALLLNAWNSELGLHLVDDDDPRLMAQNQWNNVYAYYASGRAALAWLLVRDSIAPRRHRRLLDAMSMQVQTALYPEPWSCRCTACTPLAHAGFATPPPDVHNLETAADCHGGVAKLLKTTRQKRIDELKLQHLADNKLRRAPSGLALRLDRSMVPTTVFDFMWRSRTRANYGDPSMFYVGTLDESRSRAYVHAVRVATGATMLLMEAFIAERARDTLVDAAMHFIARDRARVTEHVLAKRLRILGLFAPSI